jgi:diacylglycerol kinase
MLSATLFSLFFTFETKFEKEVLVLVVLYPLMFNFELSFLEYTRLSSTSGAVFFLLAKFR